MRPSEAIRVYVAWHRPCSRLRTGPARQADYTMGAQVAIDDTCGINLLDAVFIKISIELTNLLAVSYLELT